MEEIKSPLKAIRAYCLECSNGSASEVRNCVISDCPLYAFRFGKNSYSHPRKYSEEQLANMRARLETARKKRSKLLTGESQVAQED